MINPTWLGLTNAFPTLPSADGMLAETERATDPMASRCLTIDGGSPWGGGSSNPMTGIFPNGDAPRSLSSIERVAASNHWIEPMSQGTVFVWVQNVAGSAMPRLNTLSIIPAEPAKIYETATDVDAWADWMPRFQRSRGIPSGFKNSITHEV